MGTLERAGQAQASMGSADQERQGLSAGRRKPVDKALLQALTSSMPPHAEAVRH
jgi:hypothetical protein